jgi:hypothetical protein
LNETGPAAEEVPDRVDEEQVHQRRFAQAQHARADEAPGATMGERGAGQPPATPRTAAPTRRPPPAEGAR